MCNCEQLKVVGNSQVGNLPETIQAQRLALVFLGIETWKKSSNSINEYELMKNDDADSIQSRM